MSLYEKYTRRLPALKVKPKAREVIFTTVSCMCDNLGFLTFRKNKDGDFRVSGSYSNGMGACLTNWQMKADNVKVDLEWAADDGDWDTVINIINTGTAVTSAVRSR